MFIVQWRAWILGMGLQYCVATSLCAEPLPPSMTAQTYATTQNGTLMPAGQLEIDGRKIGCGAAPTVLDGGFPDFAAAHRGFIVLNPKRFAGLAKQVKLWIYAHECAHQTVGIDEIKADCAAVKRGRLEKWLDQAGLEQICTFISSSRGDNEHLHGAKRCDFMRACFKAAQ